MIRKIKFNSSGFRNILTSGGVKSLVDSQASAIQSRANGNNQNGGEGYYKHIVNGSWGGGRWIGFVGTTDGASMIAESENKALSRAVN